MCFQPNRRGAGKSLAALQNRATVKRLSLIRVISSFLLVSLGAWCQSEAPSAALLQGNGSNSLDVRRDLHTQTSLLDAPSVQPPTQAEKFHAFVEEARSPLTFGAVAINVGVMRAEGEYLAPGMQPSYTALYRAAVLQKESSVIFGKYLYPLLLRQDPRYHPSTRDSILSRTVYAASRVLITRNDSGKSTLNTSYFLGVLTSAVVASAYHPYWARSSSTTFKDLGATIGSDAGINVFHEFWPGIRQMLERHSPKSVKRIEDAVVGHRTQSVLPTP
jgi:hypothetical protein